MELSSTLLVLLLIGSNLVLVAEGIVFGRITGGGDQTVGTNTTISVTSEDASRVFAIHISVSDNAFLKDAYKVAIILNTAVIQRQPGHKYESHLSASIENVAPTSREKNEIIRIDVQVFNLTFNMSGLNITFYDHQNMSISTSTVVNVVAVNMAWIAGVIGGSLALLILLMLVCVFRKRIAKGKCCRKKVPKPNHAMTRYEPAPTRT